MLSLARKRLPLKLSRPSPERRFPQDREANYVTGALLAIAMAQDTILVLSEKKVAGQSGGVGIAFASLTLGLGKH